MAHAAQAQVGADWVKAIHLREKYSWYFDGFLLEVMAMVLQSYCQIKFQNIFPVAHFAKY